MEQPSHAVTNHAMVPMSAFDPQAEDTPSSIGNSLGRRPLARKKLSEMVEEELEQMIRRREFAVGEQLPSERELMTFFNVGRPSVREALAALKRKGLVQISNGERARVSRPSADTIIGELSGMAKDFLSHPGGIAHFEQLRLFFENAAGVLQRLAGKCRFCIFNCLLRCHTPADRPDLSLVHVEDHAEPSGQFGVHQRHTRQVCLKPHLFADNV